MKNNKNISRSWLPCFQGFYENWHWEPDFEYLQQDFEEQHGYKGELWEQFDYQKWHSHIAKELCDVVEHYLKDYVTSITYEKTKSPKYYNFETDAIHCEITFKPKAIRDYLYKNKEAFDNYLHDNYSSRDGFMSFHSNNFEEWESETDNFKDLTNDHKCGAILNFICEQEEIDEDLLYECLQDNDLLNSYDFFFEEFYQKLGGVDNFVHENYMKDDLLALCLEKFDAEKYDIEGIIQRVKNEIASHTLKLKL